MFNSRDIGVDLGTANTLIYKKDKGIIMREPSVVAIDERSDVILHVGQDAKDVVGRTPESVKAISPLKDGVIADFDIAATMLKMFIEKAIPKKGFLKPRIVVCIPSGVNPVERRAVRQAAFSVGAKSVAIIEEPMAAAIGAGLPVEEPVGCMVVDIGGGTTEIAVISLGNIVEAKSINSAGEAIDECIINYINKRYTLLIGSPTAEHIKINIASAYPYPNEEDFAITGRNLLDGFPKEIKVSPKEIRECIKPIINEIIIGIKDILGKIPPELASDIITNGITLTGGGANLKGLKDRIEMETGMPVSIAENPSDCVAIGTGKVLEIPAKQSSALFSDTEY